MMLLVKVKYKQDGTEEKVKARAVIMGNNYRPGIDFEQNNFAPCAHVTTVRMMVLCALQFGLQFKSFDVAQAFTMGQADRRCFIGTPPGRKTSYDKHGNPLVFEILKNTYGSPAAPRRWHVEMHNSMIDFGFTQSTVDSCLYTKDSLVALVYVDDCLYTAPRGPDGNRQIDMFIKHITDKFPLGDDGKQDCTSFIGMFFTWSKDHTTCAQSLNHILLLSCCRKLTSRSAEPSLLLVYLTLYLLLGIVPRTTTKKNGLS